MSGAWSVIRASGEHVNGRSFILLGLSDENWRRLRYDEPISVSGDELGFVGDIVLIGGPSEDAMAATLRKYGLVDRNTVVRDERT